MAIVLFLVSSFLGLMSAVASMVFFGTDVVPATALYLSIGIVVPLVTIMSGQAERRIAAAERAPHYLK